MVKYLSFHNASLHLKILVTVNGKGDSVTHPLFMNLWVHSFQNISELENCWSSWFFGGSKSKSCSCIWVFGDQMKRRTMSSEFWVFQKPHHWVSCTKKNPMAFWAVICLSSKDFTTRLMYQNRVLDLFENYDYFRTTSLKNHLDTQHGFWCGFFYPLSTGGHPFIDFFFTVLGMVSCVVIILL
jgi:hypothetical protein